MNHYNSVCVVGLGYIGLPTGCLLASKGYRVFGCDINADLVNLINQGQLPFVENDLDHLLQQVISEGKFSAFLKPTAADVFIIAVPTPFDEHRQPRLDYIESAIRSVAPHVKPGNLIILESTSPVGATEKMAEWLAEERSDLTLPVRVGVAKESQIFIAHCPERVLPGRILLELVENDRVVGGIDASSGESARRFYETFVQGQVSVTDVRTAEMTKLAENAFRDVNIAFANELANVCQLQSINPYELIRLANRHPRVNILKPGPGVGGHCIAVDPWFIVSSAPKATPLIRCAREVNDARPLQVVEEVKKRLPQMQQPIIACLGLAFKANIDDLRESPALWITEQLMQFGKVLVVEPHIKALPASLSSAELVSLEEAFEKVNMVVLLVDHQAFLNIPADWLAGKEIIDTRGIWEYESLVS